MVGEFDAGIVMAALSNQLKPAIEAQRRLIARWSCTVHRTTESAWRGGRPKAARQAM